jgi:hypothetical protein
LPHRKPNLFVIGAAKSGTTSLSEYLRGHPEIYISPLKEPAFFSPDVPSPYNTGPHRFDLERYLGLFDGGTNETRIGEASTHYLFSRSAPKLVHEFQPEAWIVAVLRNPPDMAHAMHGQRVTNGTEPVLDFEQALAADESSDGGGPDRLRMIQSSGTYRERARYAEQLERWFAVFPRERVHVIVFDDLIADTPGEYRKLLQFLGVNPEYRPASFDVRNASYRWASGWKALISSRPVRWARHALLPRLLGEDGTARVARLINRRARIFRRATARAPLSPELRKRMEADFTDDVTRLSGLLDRDLLTLWFGGRGRPTDAEPG